MNEKGRSATAWIYEGIWSILVGWFRVPKEPPTLPVQAADTIETFRPAPDFLRYLKFCFWLGLVLVDLVILVIWIVIVVAAPLVGILLAPLAFFLAVVPDIVVYVALHLRYDTTWYVMTDRSLRIRRGIWVIREVTITFENVQNVKVQQGPLQRFFGIANLIVETAGAGSSDSHEGFQVTNQGLIEGIGDPDHIRKLIMGRLGESKTVGLGDDAAEEAGISRRWTS
ncbi:MAG: PH domain-containing protein, partial [Planctomycetota bacterium]